MVINCAGVIKINEPREQSVGRGALRKKKKIRKK
jgi:hypothetical protein